MKTLRASFVFALVIFLSGCATGNQMRFKRGDGDACQFILQQAAVRGANPINTNDLPVIRNPWNYSVDQYGVVVHLARADGVAVEQLLQRSFGPPKDPKHGPRDTPTGGRWGVYRMFPPGVVIQFVSDEQGTEVIVLRPLNKQEQTDAVTKATKHLETAR